MAFLRHIFGVGLWTGLSRVAGFARDVLIGHLLGAGRLSDIFLTAFRIPNMFRDLLGEGAMSSVFIPMFSREKKSPQFASNVLSWLLIILVGITVFMEIFMPLVILGIAPGFDPEKMQMTVGVSRVMFGYVILVCSIGFLSAVLNAFSDFLLAAALPLVFNIVMIAGILLFKTNLYALAVVVLIAGLLQTVILFLRLKKRKFCLKVIKPQKTKSVKRMLKLLGWGLFGTGFYQLNVFIGVIIASFSSGAVSYLYYSDRMIQLPYAVIGLAMSTVILTKISDAITANKKSAIYLYQNAAIRSSMMLVIPCVVSLAVLAEPIIRVLFEHGEWNHAATVGVAAAMMIQAFSLPFLTMGQIYSKTLFAAGYVKTQIIMNAIGLLFSILVMVVLAKWFGYLSVPIGTVASLAVRNILFRTICMRNNLYRPNKKVLVAVAAFSVLSVAMGVALWLAKSMVTGIVPLGIVVAASVIIYLPTALFCDKIIGK